MIWQVRMLSTFGMFHFGEELFSAVCNTKHIPFMLGVGDKAGELSRLKGEVLIEVEDEASKKRWTSNFQNTEDK